MAVIAVLGGVCVLAVAVLAYVVARLSAQVRRLNGELTALANSASAPAATTTPPTPPPPSTPPTPSTPPAPVGARPRPLQGQPVDDGARADSADSVDDVPVITGLSHAEDDVDITARRVASVTFARPLIKVASLSYGLRRAFDNEHRFKVRYAMRQEFRRQRKMRRRRRAGRAPSMGWRA